jgi:hypothetical protein
MRSEAKCCSPWQENLYPLPDGGDYNINGKGRDEIISQVLALW